MRDTNFGIEIEMTGLTRQRAAKAIADLFGTQPQNCGDEWHATDNQGRRWKFVPDGSIATVGGRGRENSVEMVSPICNYSDIETIQEIVRLLRKAGAKTNDSCGIHIHVDASKHTAATLRNLCNIVVSKEDILTQALGVKENRMRFCAKADTNFISKINKKHARTKVEFMTQWYGADPTRNSWRYHQSRYRMVNIHAVNSKGTVEFRMFNSTLKHAGIIKAYIQLVLAINHQAMTQKYATPNKTQSSNLKYTFRTWLLRMGMIGDEFKTARSQLLAMLDGDIAFRNGRPAQGGAA